MGAEGSVVRTDANEAVVDLVVDVEGAHAGAGCCSWLRELQEPCWQAKDENEAGKTARSTSSSAHLAVPPAALGRTHYALVCLVMASRKLLSSERASSRGRHLPPTLLDLAPFHHSLQGQSATAKQCTDLLRCTQARCTAPPTSPQPRPASLVPPSRTGAAEQGDQSAMGLAERSRAMPGLAFSPLMSCRPLSSSR